MSLVCAECVMRRRVAAVKATGADAYLTGPEVGAETTLYGPMREAFTVLNGIALCAPCLVECTPMQRVSSLSAPNGAPLSLPVG